MKPRGEYLSGVVGEVIEIWLPPMPPEGNERASTWIEDDCKGYIVNRVHIKKVDEVIAILSQYKLRGSKKKKNERTSTS